MTPLEDRVSGASTHSAEASALGFLYQSHYALLLLWREQDDEATAYVERLDDVHLISNGQTLLQQLKHSLQQKPQSLSIASVQIWKTLHAWLDVIDSLDLAHCWFHLVTVAQVSTGSPLEVLFNDGTDRTALEQALLDEAARVVSERSEAIKGGKSPLPHAQRFKGCESFLKLEPERRSQFLKKMRIRSNQPNIMEVEKQLSEAFTSVVPSHRGQVARELMEWWNSQVLDLLTSKREGISRFEVVTRHMQIVSSIQLDELTTAFDTANVPSSYQPDSMMRKQIELVTDGDDDWKIAVREEWRARQERSRWSNHSPAWGKIIRDYDERLVEEWSDRHIFISNKSQDKPEATLRDNGYQLLRWSLSSSNKDLAPIAPKVISPFYVRGSYLVLSILGRVGWHPSYKVILDLAE